MDIKVSAKDCFITRLWQFDLRELDIHHGEWMQAIEQMRARAPEPAGRSNRHGWNSSGNLFEEMNVFQPLLKASQRCFQHAMREMAVDGDVAFGLYGWVNITSPGGYNVQHGHPGMLLSGCYYLEVPENSGRIAFADPRAGAVYSPLKTLSDLSSGKVNIQPQKGQLLIFPSWLEHSVETNLSAKERMSIPMNAKKA